MTEDPAEARRRRIEDAAFRLLAEKGFRSTSMLEIAKRAGTSNQTLYALYGSKQGLFGSIIEANGRKVQALLAEEAAARRTPLTTLQALGPPLLRYVTGESAVAMNRAAIADATESGTLGQAIEDIGRGIVFPMICALMERLAGDGRLRFDQGPEEAAQTYVALLFGETQIRLARGGRAPLTEAEIEAHAARTYALFTRAYLSSTPVSGPAPP